MPNRDGTDCSNTECHNYRKSANDNIFSTNEKKIPNNSGEIHADEKYLLNNSALSIPNFPGSKTRCMIDYLKSSLRENPGHFILHVGTNDLNSTRSLELIAKSIVNLAASLKNENHNVGISNIIVRTDNQEL